MRGSRGHRSTGVPALTTTLARHTRKLWDALTGDELHSFEHKHIVRACVFSVMLHLLVRYEEGYARFAVEMFVKVPSAWRPVLEDPSNLQIFFYYYAIAKPPISKEVTWLETDIFTAGLGFLMLSIGCSGLTNILSLLVLLISLLMVSILAGTLARLDRDAPHYKKSHPEQKEVHGSPVIDWQGQVVALNALEQVIKCFCIYSSS
ncbi:hypothetical protein Scep_017225 [Stephania cephalantha]|uniref:Uncharacterized protein n=1 Tax=Stephania cephalantha TaxID=152367 RepID=A0AAP0IR07_9MAGN